MAAELRELQEGDLEALVAGLRPADREEAIAALGEEVDLLRALGHAVARADRVWAFADEDVLLAVCGIQPLSLLTGVGSPWLMGTTALASRQREFMWWSRRFVTWARHEYAGLMNYVDARNLRAVCYLRRLHFNVEAPRPYGPAGLPFHKFHAGAI